MKVIARGAAGPAAGGAPRGRAWLRRTQPSGYLLKAVEAAGLKSTIEMALFKEEAAKPPAAPARTKGAPGSRAVRREVEQILASADFDASRRSRDFLHFIVEEALAGRGKDLTQSAIATSVFGRKDDFDAMLDPIVRIQAGRLRRSLERYYLLSGRHDPMRIELPRGSYVPACHAQAGNEPLVADERPPEPAPPAVSVAVDDWPAVAVNLFEVSGTGPAAEARAARLQEELVLELGRYGDVRAQRWRQPEERESAPRVRFFLGGRLWDEGGGLCVSTRLVDVTTGEQVWGDRYETASRPGRWSSSPDDIARVIAARVGAEEGVLVQLLAAERRKRKPSLITPTSFDAILLAYEFFLARDPSGVAPALDALREVVQADPDCGPAWTRLAHLCAANHTFEVTGIPTPLEEAITCAQRGVRLDPASRRARCVLASVLLQVGEVAAAREQAEEALRLSPDSLVYLEIVGYLLTITGDGERGLALLRAARERNPHCLPHASFGLCFEYVRRGEFKLAYQEALGYRDPTFFWRGVWRACCLAHLGRTVEAQSEVAEILRGKPDFAARGRVLIGYYVKLPEVMSRIVDGLAKAGLKLA